jgi:hypothetical protein
VDVAGLVASTLNLSNQDFLAGRLNFQPERRRIQVVNYGNIVTPVGGRVYLIAPNVENHGVISTPQGQTILAAGKTVHLVEADVPHLRVEVAIRRRGAQRRPDPCRRLAAPASTPV